MIGDPELKVAKLYDMLPADAGTTSDGRTAAANATVRTVFVIGPDKKIKLMLVYRMSTAATSTKFCGCWIPFSSRPFTRLQLR
jgi:alkyl hydroperoxide reductase subunit AhpC